jgi:hypothetical protein
VSSILMGPPDESLPASTHSHDELRTFPSGQTTQARSVFRSN